jgi:predicted RNA-binding Zn-ribbon protein involved in translation (DUF1610 family)
MSRWGEGHSCDRSVFGWPRQQLVALDRRATDFTCANLSEQVWACKLLNSSATFSPRQIIAFCDGIGAVRRGKVQWHAHQRRPPPSPAVAVLIAPGEACSRFVCHSLAKSLILGLTSRRRRASKYECSAFSMHGSQFKILPSAAYCEHAPNNERCNLPAASSLVGSRLNVIVWHWCWRLGSFVAPGQLRERHCFVGVCSRRRRQLRR